MTTLMLLKYNGVRMTYIYLEHQFDLRSYIL